MFEMPQYEVRYHDKAEWEDISEIEVLETLQAFTGGICPGISVHSGHDSG